MPHSRTRHLEALLKKTLSFSPITGVFGRRQVGKTTLVSRLANAYVTLDDRAVLELSVQDPETFLRDRSSNPLVIDECQLSPPLFPAMKEWVRTHPRPGQLLLTGSVRFSSRKAIRESLTGRLISWELLPMDLSEIHEKKLPDSLFRILDSKTVEVELKAARHCTDKDFDRSLEYGGLPGVFAVRDTAVREQRFETLLETVLERDLRLLIQTSLGYRNLRLLMRELALRQGEPLEYSELSRKTRISVITLKKIIAAFESLFLIRILETRGSEKKPVVFLEDQGEATFLCEGASNELRDLVRFLFAQLRVQHHYRPNKKVTCFQFRNRGGALVPLCFQCPTGALGIIPILEENPGHQTLATARSFLARTRNAKVLFVHRGVNDRILTPEIRILPVEKLL